MKGNHHIEQYPRAWTDGQNIRDVNSAEMTQVAGSKGQLEPVAPNAQSAFPADFNDPKGKWAGADAFGLMWTKPGADGKFRKTSP